MGACRIYPGEKMRIGIDLGGTNIKAVVMKGNKIIKKQTAQTTKKTSRQIIKIIKQASQGRKINSIGIAVPCIINRKKGRIIQCVNLPWLKQLNIKKIRIENDANCAAIAASRAYKKKNLVCLTLGTGAGGGIIIDNKLYTGRGNAGEIGHMSIDINGRKCQCGNKGCLEEYVSARGILKTARQKGIAEKDIIKLAEKARKQKKYKKIFEQMGKELGAGMANIINILNPELIVLTGGLTNSADLFLKTAKKEIKQRALAAPCDVKISKLKEQTGAIGAAMIAK